MNSFVVDLKDPVAVDLAALDASKPVQAEGRAPFYVEISLWLNPDQRELWQAYAYWSVAVMRLHGGEYLGRCDLERTENAPDSHSVFAFPSEAAYDAYRNDIITTALADKRSQCVIDSEYSFPKDPGDLLFLGCTRDDSPKA